MTTERMTDETRSALDRLLSLASDCDATHEERLKMSLLIAEVEQEQAEKIRALEVERAEWQDATGCASPRHAEKHIKAREVECHNLREQLRLANDKMAEQVRQARWEVATSIFESSGGMQGMAESAIRIRDANAPKD